MESIFKTSEGKQIIMERYAEILSLWPAPCEHFTVPTAYGDTFVIVSGVSTGTPVVLLHGRHRT